MWQGTLWEGGDVCGRGDDRGREGGVMGRKEGEPFLAVGREEAQATQSRSVLAHLGGRWSLLLRTARSAHFVTCRPRGCGGIAVQVTHSHLSLPPLTHSHRSLTPHRRINPPPFITPPPVGSLLTHPLTSTSHTPPPLTHPHRSLSRTSHSPLPLTPTSHSPTSPPCMYLVMALLHACIM